jgi:hypothetical protein
MARERQIDRILTPASESVGGMRIARMIGGREAPIFDPFLLFEEIRCETLPDAPVSIGQRPFRGLDRVTYVPTGRVYYREGSGEEGAVEPGGLRWVATGRGLVDEMWLEPDGRAFLGFQIWMNEPVKRRMEDPRRWVVGPGQVPTVRSGGLTVRVIAGRIDRAPAGPVSGLAAAPVLFDIAIAPPHALKHSLPARHNAFVHVYEGVARVGGDPLGQGEIGLLTQDGGELALEASGEPARLLLVAGKRLNEPVLRHGGLVASTMAELRRAVDDYYAGRL